MIGVSWLVFGSNLPITKNGVPLAPIEMANAVDWRISVEYLSAAMQAENAFGKRQR